MLAADDDPCAGEPSRTSDEDDQRHRVRWDTWHLEDFAHRLHLLLRPTPSYSPRGTRNRQEECRREGADPIKPNVRGAEEWQGRSSTLYRIQPISVSDCQRFRNQAPEVRSDSRRKPFQLGQTRKPSGHCKTNREHTIRVGVSITSFLSVLITCRVMRVLPNVVLFLGPIAFDILFETLEKQKRKSNSQIKPCVVVVENFRWKNNAWKRLQKGGASSISAQL